MAPTGLLESGPWEPEPWAVSSLLALSAPADSQGTAPFCVPAVWGEPLGATQLSSCGPQMGEREPQAGFADVV